MKTIKIALLLLIVQLGFNYSASACHAVTISETSATDNLDGTYTYVFNVCMGIEDTWGFWMDFTGANVISASPASLTGTYSTINLSDPPVSGNGDLEYGDFDNTGGTKFSEGTNLECFAVTVTFDGAITAAFLENDQENVTTNCTGAVSTTSCFGSNVDYIINVETYGPCNGPSVVFNIDGTPVLSVDQNGLSTSLGICGTCSTSMGISAGTKNGKKPLCTGGVASYSLTNGDGSLTYSSGGGDSNTSYILGAPTCPLSADLISFEGELIDDEVILNWVISSQEDNIMFVVERSSDLIFWSPIAFVTGDGTTEEVMSYSYKDKEPEVNENYYRIKFIDINGKDTYSNNIIIDVIESNDALLLDVINYLGQSVDESYIGFVIEIYDDGTSVKTYRDNNSSIISHQ